MGGMENIILSEVSLVQKAKAACSLSYVKTDLTRIQQYNEKQAMLRGGHI
jgi:hypothetical protein